MALTDSSALFFSAERRGQRRPAGLDLASQCFAHLRHGEAGPGGSHLLGLLPPLLPPFPPLPRPPFPFPFPFLASGFAPFQRSRPRAMGLGAGRAPSSSNLTRRSRRSPASLALETSSSPLLSGESSERRTATGVGERSAILLLACCGLLDLARSGRLGGSAARLGLLERVFSFFSFFSDLSSPPSFLRRLLFLFRPSASSSAAGLAPAGAFAGKPLPCDPPWPSP